jgi:hypothetical protein
VGEQPVAWQSREVRVPVWSLMMLGAALAGGGGLLGLQTADASNSPDPVQIEQMGASLRRIEGRLDAIERQLSAVASMAHTHTGIGAGTGP